MTMSSNFDEDVDDHMFSDPEDFVDDISDSELLEDVLDSKPKPYDGQNTMILVDGIPQVGVDRLEKLKSVLSKLFSKFGTIVSDHYPVDDAKKTKGFFFLEFENHEMAKEAVKLWNGYRLDKQHVFIVNLLTDFDKYEKITENYQQPEPQPYVDHGNLKQWLQEPDCHDQYVAMYEGGDKTTIYLNTNPEPTVIEERNRWSDTCVLWSPLGTFLCTFHQKGIAFWGGESFKQVSKFSHQDVQFLDISPQENYLITCSPQSSDGKKEIPSIHVWDIRTGMLKRAFHADNDHHTWPIFKWSHDDKFFAKAGTDSLSIYETPSFGLLDKKSIKMQGIKGFSWSPTDNILAYWVAEDKDAPARVTLIEIPSRKELRTKNLFNVNHCKMLWQKTGDHLGVVVSRYAKSKKEKNEIKYSGTYYNFETFFMREKQIPVDSIEIKENVLAHEWEPIGNKFSIIHGDNPATNISFYGVKPGGTVTLLKKFDRKPFNAMFWSPQGQFIVLASLNSLNGSLEFMDTSDFTTMAQGEHYNMTDVEWDPTGRYVTTAVSYWHYKFDNSYWLWSFQGKLIRRHLLDKFNKFLWRPRPPTLLSEEKIKEIKKNLKKYSTQFDIKDRMSLSKASKELVEKRRELVDKFRKFYAAEEEVYESERPQRLEMRDEVDDSGIEAEYEEEVVEYFLKQEETEIEINE